MDKELRAFTNGAYVFQETEEEGQFLFYRNDGDVLGDVNFEPMDMYQNYLCMKMMCGEINCAVRGDMHTETSEDGKVMLLVTTMEKIPLIDEEESYKKVNPVKRMIKSIFGSKNK